MNHSVLVTGATAGIGEALARQFAQNGYNLVVVSRDQAHVDRIAALLEEEFAITAVGLAEDLTHPDAPARLKSELDSRSVEVEILVNNAGRGAAGKFHEISLEDHLAVIRLNIEALTRLTHLYLPEFLRRGRGKILQVGSIAGFQPGPLMAVYHASKAFVVSLSEAMAEELKETPVTVTCLCPGPTHTEFFNRAGLDNSRVGQNENLQADPADVAKGAYEALMKGERVLVAGGMNKALTFLRRVMPESAQSKFNEMLYSAPQGDS